MKFADILEKFQQMAITKREKGDLFERFIASYMLTTRFYEAEIDKVWLWSEWPLNGGKADHGIDLVALTKTGQYWAIQCKFYSADSTVGKDDVDSFLSASSEKFIDENGKECRYSARFLVATCSIGPKAYDTMNKQEKSASFITTEQLDDSGIDWEIFWEHFSKDSIGPIYEARNAVKQLRPHQQEALNNVLNGFDEADRGKLIMACGTGKTFTSLRIAEAMVPDGGIMLYLVPSLSLMGQTLRAWTIDAKRPLRPILVCSDTTINKQDARQKDYLNDDNPDANVSDLAHPATTSPGVVINQWNHFKTREEGFTVVFSTYQSSGAIMEAQKYGFPEFDLIICDEAHRTTGVDLSETEKSAFTLVHENANIQGKKRLYMTATPRIYGEAVKKKAEAKAKAKAKIKAELEDELENDAGVKAEAEDDEAEAQKEAKAKVKTKSEAEGVTAIYSMDDETTYGPVFHELTFGKAVSEGLLSDYKVIILTVRDSITREYSDLINDERREQYRKSYPRMSKMADEVIDELIMSDLAKVIGCWQGLAKQSQFLSDKGRLSDDFAADPEPMKRAVAFAQSIKISRDIIVPMFKGISEQISKIQDRKAATDPDFHEPRVVMQMKHVDGSETGNDRKKKLDWLAKEPEPNCCHILSNVRCLSEGVDVPSLDAVLFLSPRNSIVDIVQSVGRVMRTAPGKKFGYIILPIGIPEYANPEVVLDNNEKFRVVWQVLQALRSHDKRLKIEINKIKLNEDTADDKGVIGEGNPPDDRVETITIAQRHIEFLCDEDMKDRIRAKVVQKCGDRDYLDESAKVIAEIAKAHIDHFRDQLQHPTDVQRAAFDEFLERLQQDLNPSIDRSQAIEMISQHIITQPVFQSLFKNYKFAEKNVISRAFNELLRVFQDEESQKDWDELEKIREDIRERVEGITTLSGKQRVITTLYDQFFRTADPKTAEKLGIVYTPVAVVDFIIHSVEHILRTEFNSSLNKRYVHILDPFTGTGTFIVRLLESGILETSNFAYKFNNDLHANEIILLAYYIAAINIEEAFHTIGMRDKYQPFPGLLLTDTFQTGEKDMPADTKTLPLPESPERFTFPEYELKDNEVTNVENDQRILRQRRSTIQVIIGNPPYSVGQGSANDNNQNQKYPKLDKRVAETYVAQTTATNKNSLYDSYIKAFRWASDRIGERGVIGFVTNGGWLDGNAMDGFRKCLQDEFTSIYLINLRGNARTSGELRRQEGDNVFGIGTRTPVMITILVKNPKAKKEKGCQIFYYAVENRLKRDAKLDLLRRFEDISNVPFDQITPNAQGDWINQRNPEFETFIALGTKEKDDKETTFFEPFYSRGFETGRDAWVYNFSDAAVRYNIQRLVECYNAQVGLPEEEVTNDPTKISWTRATRNDWQKGTIHRFVPDIRTVVYRPFVKMFSYWDKSFVTYPGQFPKLFPTPTHKNLVIGVQGIGSSKDFSCIITDVIADVQLQFNGQWFPLYYYEPAKGQTRMDEKVVKGFIRHDGITDAILTKFQEHCADPEIGKEDIFYFVYGYLHDPKYRKKFAADLKKMLPRLPLVSKEEFWAYSKAGRKLANLHLHYETQPCHPDVFIQSSLFPNYEVQKMSFVGNVDKSIIRFNEETYVCNIPPEAYQYVVNGKPAIEWVMERYQVTTDKASGIVNDPNTYSKDPKYIFNLLLSVITVSMETRKILLKYPFVRTFALEDGLK